MRSKVEKRKDSNQDRLLMIKKAAKFIERKLCRLVLYPVVTPRNIFFSVLFFLSIIYDMRSATKCHIKCNGNYFSLIFTSKPQSAGLTPPLVKHQITG